MQVRRVISGRLLGALCVAALAAAGPQCISKTVYWSPDGQQAVIVGRDQTYVASFDGKLSAPAPASFVQVAWFADSKRLVGVQPKSLMTWAEIQPYLSSDQRARIMELAEPFRRQVLAHEGSWEGWRPELNTDVSDREIIQLWVYIREQHPEELQRKLGDAWEQFSKLGLPLGQLRLCEVDETLRPGRVLVETLDDIATDSLHVSPDGSKIAYVLRNVRVAEDRSSKTGGTISDAGGTLMVLALQEGAQPQVVESFAAAGSDFTADSRSLVYATTKPVPQGGNLVLGSIERRSIADENGRVRVGEPEQLVGIIYFPQTRIVCLDDGEILFSAINLVLPMAMAESPKGPTLFSIRPEARATIVPMLTRSAEATAPTAAFEHGAFDVRPDGGAVTMLGNGRAGEVGWYTFATGRLEYVATDNEEWELLERPAWRNNEELSLVAPPGHPWGSPNRPELILYNIKTKQARCISRNWPDELMNGWKEKTTSTQTRPE
ncbi:MAG TPA: hypothetical protein PLQ89_12730 [Phycisphaerae bacterium]|nr:hypothetical protein [Phycisphaerae bacterium]HOJ75202.1 hypothetical protein [Phycisphaerae bacterium]HOM52447.1 hypothetical protein [Phycisphaerae bacterium]HOQ86569.1 hypothetical protein [Phycisphaerae bacterium]HPP27721.1 hypothetical protein [Phycisphaerae bacterium]